MISFLQNGKEVKLRIVPTEELIENAKYNEGIAMDAAGALENNTRWKHINTGYRNGNFYPITVNDVRLVGYGTVLSQHPKWNKIVNKQGYLTRAQARDAYHSVLRLYYDKIRKDASEYDQRADTISFNAWLPLLMSKYMEGNVGDIYQQYTDAAINGDTEEMKRLVGTTPHADNTRRNYMKKVDIYGGVWPQRNL